jgi:hypothetical protein
MGLGGVSRHPSISEKGQRARGHATRPIHDGVRELAQPTGGPETLAHGWALEISRAREGDITDYSLSLCYRRAEDRRMVLVGAVLLPDLKALRENHVMDSLIIGRVLLKRNLTDSVAHP